MAQADVVNIAGQKVGTVELSESVFNVEPNEDLMFRYVNMQLSGRRAGLASAKTRSEVRGGGRKPWAQKHTGRARVGSTRSPLWRHGGVIHGPKPKDWSMKLTKKMKKVALRSALSLRLKEGNLIVLDDLKFDRPKTKQLREVLNNLGLDKTQKTLFVLPWQKDEYQNVRLSGKNIYGVKVIIADNPGNKAVNSKENIDGLNVYDIVNHEKLVITADLVRKIEEVLGR
ncbi:MULTISPECIES: 50S ribosomal protein L4 [Mesotoga]|jgi:large subunit ribosomal protein L4|uniref:Large ribosomal subunit protein uL4 n=1 Tax=Mesotoga prima MesG1.Ag.4.2 TaxID=660470 RepID=I2F392_9BACT|nr:MULTISPECIES: 50S ribosomal protein L4 [Mesotoga]CCU85937.1 50S ribosomal protein L4 [Mesotoga infera]AFK06395.1 50S ribosomal protein L4, bacterial/organelle [Mesotoga prima MesG1.Ag.4.2]MCB1224008.1 50S ribosomal protein L4 [Mesotoga sp.]MDK2943494.1 large subunit ribosomal protein [Mesotoga sp.]RLL87752.1 50S ribosomal protein L4 [Mesotoga sp. H07pep.5.4]